MCKNHIHVFVQPFSFASLDSHKRKGRTDKRSRIRAASNRLRFGWRKGIDKGEVICHATVTPFFFFINPFSQILLRKTLPHRCSRRLCRDFFLFLHIGIADEMRRRSSLFKSKKKERKGGDKREKTAEVARRKWREEKSMLGVIGVGCTPCVRWRT